jgi:hypothetical protein
MVSVIEVVVEINAPKDFGIASGMNTLFRVVGGSIGPVLGASILSGSAIEVLIPPATIITAYTPDGFVWTRRMAFIVMVIGTVATFRLRAEKREGILTDRRGCERNAPFFSQFSLKVLCATTKWRPR